MKLSDFDYKLPEELIAQKPMARRDSSRLLILNRKTKTLKHDYFFNLPNFLRPGDVLVFNNSKVFKARLFGSLDLTDLKNKKLEIFLLKKIENNSEESWQVLAKPGKKLKPNQKIYFAKNFWAVSAGHYDQETFLINFNLAGKKFWQALEKFAKVPLPPYIKNSVTLDKYQTVYAKESGSVAAPTAGLHFTKILINQLKKMGVQIEFVTLHVGLGTFLPVKTDNIKKHQMHSEFFCLNKSTADRLNLAKKESRRIIAVGTTACRVLESATKNRLLIPKCEETKIFIYPPYKFKTVDALITNFHLPKSTLLMLISAFAKSPKSYSVNDGRNFILTAYKTAIRKKYRFFSFGDAMLIN